MWGLLYVMRLGKCDMSAKISASLSSSSSSSIHFELENRYRHDSMRFGRFIHVSLAMRTLITIFLSFTRSKSGWENVPMSATHEHERRTCSLRLFEWMRRSSRQPPRCVLPNMRCNFEETNNLIILHNLITAIISFIPFIINLLGKMHRVPHPPTYTPLQSIATE